MCFFITLVVNGSSPEAIGAVMASHGRAAKPIDNAAVRRSLREGEAAFLTTPGHCDCSTVLAQAVGKQVDVDAAEAKARKKGWSAAKLERWRTDREKAQLRAEERAHAQYADSIDGWIAILHDILAVPGVEEAGLLVHFYSDDIEAEEFAIERKAVALGAAREELEHLPDGRLLTMRPL